MANGFRGLFDTPIEAGTGNQAVSGFEQLLGNPLFTGGIGLLAGSLDERTGPGEDLLNALGIASQTVGTRQDREFQRQKIEANREQLLQQQRQQRARDEVFRRATQGQEVEPGSGLLSAGLDDPSTIGLLAQAAPDQFFSNIIESQFREPDDEATPLQLLRAAGIDPNSAEGRDIIRKNLTGGDSDLLDQALAILQIEQTREELATTRRTRDDELRQERNAIRDGLRNTRQLVRLTDQLEDTALETGLGMEDLRRAAAGGINSIKQTFGVGDTRAQELATAFDDFERLSMQESVGQLELLRDIGTISNNEFEKVISTGPSPSKTPDANRRAIADRLEVLQRAAEDKGISVPAGLDAEIERLRGGSGEAAEIERMTDTQLLNVRPSTLNADGRHRLMRELSKINPSNLTPAQRQRLDKRLTDLGF